MGRGRDGGAPGLSASRAAGRGGEAAPGDTLPPQTASPGSAVPRSPLPSGGTKGEASHKAPAPRRAPAHHALPSAGGRPPPAVPRPGASSALQRWGTADPPWRRPPRTGSCANFSSLKALRELERGNRYLPNGDVHGGVGRRRRDPERRTVLLSGCQHSVCRG